jgi:hypothetical protein
MATDEIIFVFVTRPMNIMMTVPTGALPCVAVA